MKIFRMVLLVACLGCVVEAQTTKAVKQKTVATNNYEAEFAEAAARYGVEAKLLWVIGYLESRFNPKAVSPKGARGLMQFMPATAERFGLHNPHEPAQAIDAAARYVRQLQAQFGARNDLILAAYNAGETAVTAYLTGQPIRIGSQVINAAGQQTNGIPPYRETERYVANGMRLLNGGKLRTGSEEQTLITRKKKSMPATKSVAFNTAQKNQPSETNTKPRLSISFQETLGNKR